MSSRSAPFSFNNIRSQMKCQKIHIFCLEGVHGVGKTSICNALKDKGYTVIDEGFMQGENFENYVSSFGSSCKCHTFALELIWVGKMLATINSLCNAHRKGEIVLKDRMIFCDRCFITPIIYGALTANEEAAFLTLNTGVNSSISGEFNADFHFVYLSRPSIDGIFTKVMKRLEDEPVRNKLNEADYNFLNDIEEMYAVRHRWFDMHYELGEYGEETPEEEADDIVRTFKSELAFDDNVNEMLDKVGQFLGKHIENGK